MDSAGYMCIFICIYVTVIMKDCHKFEREAGGGRGQREERKGIHDIIRF